ncbi:hypothetical protein [Streptomyces otsuchiensis]|uniref:hypothetical protein n=1 Tax=Streptomyces otsuchiensis TaxID=2681388 RepID=UPI001030B138|nr:hypothetical protein [Streptomyces otsuchiensis]
MPMAFHVQPVGTRDGKKLYQVRLDRHGCGLTARLLQESAEHRRTLPAGVTLGPARGALRAVHVGGDGPAARAAKSTDAAKTAKTAKTAKAAKPVRSAAPVHRPVAGAARDSAASASPCASRPTARLRLVPDLS